MKLIDKSALVAEIKRRIKCAIYDVEIGALESRVASKTLNLLLSFIDTLEVKEVDLEKEIKDYIHALPHAKTGVPNGWRLSWHEDKVIEIAKHFYELGLKAQKGE